MKKSLISIFIILALAMPLAWSQTYPNSSRDLTPEESAYVKKINQLLVLEVQHGIEDIKQGKLNDALIKFVEATKIAPNDPMAYQLLINALIHSRQEDLAYQFLEKAGQNNTDSNAVIKELYDGILESYPSDEPEGELPLISIPPFKDNKKCAVSFMFDDGEPSVTTAILPMFEEYGWRTSISINPGMIPAKENDPYRAGWRALRRALLSGHEIANHGLTHLPLNGLTAAQLHREVEDSRAQITKILGVQPRTFVFPEDKVDAAGIKAASKNHIAVRDHEMLQKLYPKVLLPVFGGKYFASDSGRRLIEVAMRRRLWLIPECHGLFSPYIKRSFKAISPELLRDQLEYMKNNSKDIWVARFITVFCYLKEREATTINLVHSTDNSLEFELKNSLDKNLYLARLTVLINPKNPPTRVQATLKTTETWIPASIVDGKIIINILPNSGPITVEWE